MGILYYSIRHRIIDGQVQRGLGIGRPNRGRVGLLEVLARVTSPLESSRPWQIYHVNDWSTRGLLVQQASEGSDPMPLSLGFGPSFNLIPMSHRLGKPVVYWRIFKPLCMTGAEPCHKNCL
ncbi:uncharacterized protein FFM5_01907 [Fusarium fujikuroi]|nr:uncharacterized protein FFM5_01907 [Fusarium fujikuroi]SCV26298.1 uncharacterized protein FFB14_00994 [Fusarium fujikuroi]